MSASSAIGMVGESLRNLLVGEMKITPSAEVTLLGPDESAGARRVNLFLYRVQENPFLRNADWRVTSADPTRIGPPPLSINLFYLLTPYATNDLQTGATPAHEILGEAMRVFYENAIVPNQYLVDGLKDAPEQIKIMQHALDLDELSQVWSTFKQPFRLSVLYEISVVQVDQAPASERPIPQRVRQIGVPEVDAPFVPPVVDRLQPPAGPSATVLTLSGSHLTGWRAYVTMSGRTLADGLALSADQFTVTVPADLPVGFHQLRVDVSHLFARTFFFEKTT
ncbi:MAG TPA: DUF4255 domain-containing protein [Burkholderiales bacterium]|nr:DUF4255 domain-containing protein [Burkholderiales bacterium]